MLTARLSMFSVLAALCTAGCYSAQANADDITHTSGNTVPDDGNATTTAQGNTTPQPTLGPVGFTMSWEINPNECLQPNSGMGTTALTTGTCNGSMPQRWTWVGGKVINVSTGGCLDMGSQSAGAVVEVAACSTSSATQNWFNNYDNQFYQVFDSNTYVIAPTSSSTGDGINFEMAIQAPATANREWMLGVSAPETQQTGYTIVFAADGNMCLTNAANGPEMQTCGNAPAQQLWNFDNATFSQGSECLSANGTTITLASCDSTQTAQQWWLGGGADIISGTSAGTPLCLFANSDNSLTLVPNSTLNRGWMFGTVSVE
jgi:hypothetical protein